MTTATISIRHLDHRNEQQIGLLSKYEPEQIKSAKKAGIELDISSHIFRYSFAAHSFEHGLDLHYIQMLPGHTTFKTTKILRKMLRIISKRLKSNSLRYNSNMAIHKVNCCTQCSDVQQP